jgi:hypothetical protein
MNRASNGRFLPGHRLSGRPTAYRGDVADRIIEAVANGGTLKPGFPGRVECLVTLSPDFAKAVSRLARPMGRDRAVRDG